MSDTQHQDRTKSYTTKDGTQVTETHHADKSHTVERVYPDTSTSTSTTHTDANGTVHTTGTRTNPDGSTDSRTGTRTTDPDTGAETTSQTHTEKGGDTKVTTERVEHTDGRVETSQRTETKDGTVKQTDSTKSADGSVTNTDATKTDANGKQTEGSATEVRNPDGTKTTTRTTETPEGEEQVAIEKTDAAGKVVERETTVFHKDGTKTIDTETTDGDDKITSHTEVDADGSSHTEADRVNKNGESRHGSGDREVLGDREAGDKSNVQTLTSENEDGSISQRRLTFDKDGALAETETFDPETGLWVSEKGPATSPNGDTFDGKDVNDLFVDAESGDTFDPETGDRHVAATGTTFHHEKNPETGEYENKGTWESSDGSHGTFGADVFEGESPDGETFRASGDLVGPPADADAGPDEPVLTLETGNKNEPGSKATTDYYEDGGVTTSQENGETYSRDGFLIDEIIGESPGAGDYAPGTNTPDAELDELAAESYDTDRDFDDLIDALIADPASGGEAQQASNEAAEASPNADPERDSSPADNSQESDQSSGQTKEESDEDETPTSTSEDSDEGNEEDSDDDAGDSSDDETGNNSEVDDTTQEEPEDAGSEDERGDGSGVAGGEDFDPDKIRDFLGVELVEDNPWDDPSFQALAQPGEGDSGPTPDAPTGIDAPDSDVGLPDHVDGIAPQPDPLDLLGQPAAHENDAIDTVNALDAAEEHYEQVSNPGNGNLLIEAAPNDALQQTDATAFGAGSGESIESTEPAEPAAAIETVASMEGEAPVLETMNTDVSALEAPELSTDITFEEIAPTESVENEFDDLSIDG